MSSIESIINRQLLQWEINRKKQLELDITLLSEPPPIITISRQKGSRGSYLASRLAQSLGYERLHREVIDMICKSSGYRKKIIESLDDSYRNDIELMVESLMAERSVDHYDYIRYLFKVVLSMSKLGGVVLVGRAGNFILGPRRGFHIRCIAPGQNRIDNLVKYGAFRLAEANQLITKSDKKRSEFVRKLFNADINDPQNYDLVINTANIDIEDLIISISCAVKAKFQKLKYLN